MRRTWLITAALAVLAGTLFTAPDIIVRAADQPAADPAIAYIDRGDSELYFFRLMVMDADGSNQTEVYRVGDGVGQDDTISDPCWSPDNDQIVFVAGGNLWTIDVEVVDGTPRGSNPTRLTDGAGGWSAPRWSPDGSNIVAKCARKEIALVPTTGGSPETIIKVSSGSLSSPTWSRDGTKVAVLHWRKKTTRVKVFKVATGQQVNSILLRGSVAHLRWARTATAVLFERMDTVSDKPSFYELNLTARKETLICTSPGLNWGEPCWSPDDSALSFGSQESFDRPIGRRLRVYDISDKKVTTLVDNGVEPDWRR